MAQQHVVAGINTDEFPLRQCSRGTEPNSRGDNLLARFVHVREAHKQVEVVLNHRKWLN